MTIEELKTQVFGKHWQDESWHEVLRLIVGMIDTSFAGEIIDYLMALDGKAQKFVNLFLAAECLSEVRNRSVIAPTATQLLKTLKALTYYADKIRIQAVSAVATIWKDDPDTLPWLKLHAIRDDDLSVRRAAVQELARGWKDDPDTLPLLKQIATSDDHSFVRSAAVQGLARGWKDDLDTLPWLKQIATSDDHSSVRLAAVQELARDWKDEPWMLEFLHNCTLNDPFKRKQDREDNPRQTALEIIIEQYPNHSHILPLLQDRAENDLDVQVRNFARRKLKQLERQN